MSDSVIYIPHKIGSETTFAAFCAELYRQGIRFVAHDHGDQYVIELQGY
jgi:hypothetical protein